jgi:hypothetical protein
MPYRILNTEPTIVNVASAAIAPHEPANDGPDLLGSWGAGTEIGTALFGTEHSQLNTICAARTSQLRYHVSEVAMIGGLTDFSAPWNPHAATSVGTQRPTARRDNAATSAAQSGYCLGVHSRAIFCASASCSGVIRAVKRSRFFMALAPTSASHVEKRAADKLYHMCACT